MDDDYLDIYLEDEPTTIEDIRALEPSTTLTELTVNFREYEPTPANNRRFIEPLCRCLASLHRQNEHHSLRKWVLERADLKINGMSHAFEQCLVAAKQFGIFHVHLKSVYSVPDQFLMEFCRDNNSLKVLELADVSFSGEGAAMSLPLYNGPPNNSVILTLDKLALEFVSFKNSTAATCFANLVARVNASSLCLDKLTARDSDDMKITESILSELKMPSVEQLTLRPHCRMEHFISALDAGTTTVTDLDVSIEFDKKARLKLLARFIRRSVKLNSLTIRLVHSDGPQRNFRPHLFQAMEECATVTYIEVNRFNHQRDIVLGVCPEVQQMLQEIASRNRELDQFATNPGTYPTAELPELMRQFDNCPTGRYMLARRLPKVLSFAELCAMHLLRRRTTCPTRKNRNRNKSCA